MATRADSESKGATTVTEHLCPRIACYETSEIGDLLQKTVHLPDVATLLKPWQASAVEKVQLRSSTFEVVNVAHFPLDIQAAAQINEEGAYEHAGGWLDDVGTEITRRTPAWLQEIEAERAASAASEDVYKTPWFGYFLTRLLSLKPLATCDTFGHPVAAILITSVNHPEPLNALAALYAATSPPHYMSDKPYVDPNILRFYVVLHDVRNTQMSESEALLEQIRRAYGVHCAILPFNSYDPAAPPPLEGKKDSRPAYFDTLWQPYLPENVNHSKVEGLGERDILGFRIFLRDMVVMSLVPWMERNVQQWNETLAASRKGLTGRLFSAGRKYFGGSGSGRSSPSGQPLPSYDFARGYYPYQTQEAQTRRLADFAFMIRDYKLAASTYEFVKKDASNDKAWRDAAQSARLNGLAYLMQAASFPSLASKRTDGDTFSEQAHAIVASSNASLSAAVALDDIKMSCLYYGMYSDLGESQQVSDTLCRCAGQMEEITAALLLEQAAVAELSIYDTPFRRKAAFHLSMAAQRYEKTGYKWLARQCLVEAAKLFNHRPKNVDPMKAFDPVAEATTRWQSIEQHTSQALGRQAYHLGRSDEALLHFLALLVQRDNSEDTHDMDEGDQDIWDDFVLAFANLGPEGLATAGTGDSQLKARFFHPDRAEIILSSDSGSLTNDGCDWDDLELRALKLAREGLGKTISLQQRSPYRTVGIGEAFTLRLVAQNPLDAMMTLSNLVPVAVDDGKNTLDDKNLQVDGLHDVTLNPRGEQTIQIKVRFHCKGTFQIQSLAYLLNEILPCEDSLFKKGKRLHVTKQHLVEPTYAQDKSYNVVVRDAVPQVTLDLSRLPNTLLSGQIVHTTIALQAANSQRIDKIFVICDSPNFISFETSEKKARHLGEKLLLSSELSDSASFTADMDANQALEIFLTFRGDAVGLNIVNFVFGVCSRDTEKMYTQRVSHVVTVEDFLSLSVVPKATFSVEQPYALHIEASAEHRSEQIRIDGVTIMSPSWRLTKVQGFGDKSHALQRNQTHSLLAYLSIDDSVKDEDDFCQPNYSSQQLEALLQGTLDLKALPSVDRVSLTSQGPMPIQYKEDMLRGSKSGIRLDILQAEFPSIDSKLIRNIFRLFSSSSVDLLVNWSTESGKKGYQHVSGMLLGPCHNTVQRVLERAEGVAGGIYAESQSERIQLVTSIANSELAMDTEPVICVVMAPQQVELKHGSKPVSVPVSFHLRNLSVYKEADYRLSLIRQTSGQSQSCRWAGKITFDGSLSPLQSIVIKTQVISTHPGVVDIGHWLLEVGIDEDTEGGNNSSKTWQIRGSPRLVFICMSADSKRT